MSMIIASLVCVALLTVSLAHFLWAFGRRWPIRDRALLARTVIGRPGVDTMPAWYVSLLIAVFTLACAVFALALADHDSGGTTMSLIALVPGVLFLARGIAGYLPAWRQTHPEEPFHTNDLRVYSPLCLIVGIGFIVLALLRMA